MRVFWRTGQAQATLIEVLFLSPPSKILLAEAETPKFVIRDLNVVNAITGLTRVNAITGLARVNASMRRCKRDTLGVGMMF